MKILALIVVVVLLAAAGIAVWLAVTTPSVGPRVRFPLGEEHRALLGRVPASAEAFVLVPAPAALEKKLAANRVTADALAGWLDRQTLPGPWLLGSASALLWREEKQTSYAIRFDPVRALLARGWLLFAPLEGVRWEGSTLVIARSPSAGAPLTDEVVRLAAGLPEGDAFVVQRGTGRDFPPIGRPAVTSVAVSAGEIVLVSRALAEGARPGASMQPRFAAGALLAASFVEAPRLMGDLRRILGTDVSGLLSDGGSVVLYEVDAGTLLPRPRGVIAVKDPERHPEAVEEVRKVAGLVGESRVANGELLVTFDGKSIDRYLADEMVPGRWAANRWAVRIDPARLVPLLDRLSGSPGLRFAAPRLHRAVRDLERWAGALERAKAVEAADSVDGGVEELRVRVEAK